MRSLRSARPGDGHAVLVLPDFLAGDFSTAPLRGFLRQPVPEPTTSIYSRSDGIVSWQSCLEAPGEQRENIEVECSHTGMGFHPDALEIIADRLAQPEGAWRTHPRAAAS